MTQLDNELAALATELRASTVRVHDGERGSGAGSGWTAHGLIVTNALVVRGRYAEGEFEDGRRERAMVLRRDDARDLAVIRVRAGGLRPGRVRDSRTRLPGELVVAVGNP
ncbi:MAG: trypsin-like peptidase domain-containing protein, partial [Candidatus Eremiobacteraeota bacterium]|nr:trypsin-like peptidase domain-containing protein [Candidatus Eremiobacteraeota bacterium]